MDDEFKLCWKNFQDNIASGFQNLYDRGDLVDVTLACDGKLLHAHKIVLAICSPYFQEIFLTNPCKHPIIILKDVHFNIMCELLEFMYQGVVNVKHTELQSFMKIGQLLQIKGLATNSSAAPMVPEKTLSKKATQAEFGSNLCSDSVNSHNISNDVNSSDIPNNSANNTSTSAKSSSAFSPASSPTPVGNQHSKNSPDNSALNAFESNSNLKRHLEGNTDVQSIYSKKHFRRTGSHTDQISDQNDENDEALEHVNPEDFFLSAIPHISMVESRYDLNSVKREGDHIDSSATSSSMRNSFGSSFGFEYNLYKNSSCPNIGSEFSNEINIPNDYSKNFGNHMDIPPSSSSVTMLSTTSLLHGNCVFNRNNTVATQQGMKTYWLCKSYRISMCRARCITHQGRVISATGVHNHPPHMRKAAAVSGGTNFNEGAQVVSSVPPNTPACNISGNIIAPTTLQAGISNINNTSGGCFPSLRSSQAPLHMFQQNQPSQHPLSISPTLSYSSHLHPHPNLMIQPHSSMAGHSNIANAQQLIVSQHGCPSSLPAVSQSQNSVIQNSMLNVNMLHHPGTGHHPVSAPHSPYIRDSSVQAHSSNNNLVITPVTPESPKHVEHGSSKMSKHSKHDPSTESSSSCGTLKLTPHAVQSCNEGTCSSDLTRVLESNITVSPSDMRINPKISVVRSGVDAPTNSETRCIGTPEQTHDARILQITSESGHNFKIENI